MRFTILTLFPEMFAPVLDHSILGRARQRGLIETHLVQIRTFATDKHHRVDDAPYGGGPGMVLKPDVLERATHQVRTSQPGRVILMTPQGKRFTQEDAQRLAGMTHLILVCGHYEGLDERWVQHDVDEELSLGDFVLTGGELPAMVVLDAVARLLPGVLGDEESAAAESFGNGLFDHPHYTRPAVWQPLRGGEARMVPATLLSGNHGEVAAWRRRQALLRTLIRRPDLLQKVAWNRQERRLIEALARDLEAMDHNGEPRTGGDVTESHDGIRES